MNAPWVYRVFTFALVSVLSLVVIVLSVKSKDNLDDISKEFRDDSRLKPDAYPYATLGIAVGVMTVITKVPMLALDFFFSNIFTSFIVFELAWSSILWVLWIAVGGTTLSNGNTIFPDGHCSDFDVIVPKAQDVCDDIHPIASVAFVIFALLFLYSVVLAFFAFTASGSTPPWTTSLKNRNK